MRWTTLRRSSVAVVAAFASATAAAAETLPVAERGEIAACRAIAAAVERAGCYDRLFGPPEAAREEDTVLAADARGDSAGAVDATDMAIRWELDERTNRGLWLPRAHRRTYILPVRWSDRVNQRPSSPSQPAAVERAPYRPIEGKFQLSLKLKALDDVLGSHADVWVAYTQQSNWQVYNGDLSRAFRETSYEPEAFVTLPLRVPVLGLTARVLNVGVAHQSNGQPDPRSRSWNRVYAQLGFERGPFALYLKPWLRISEPRSDDNPDITDYVGRAELQAIWSRNDHTVSLTVRNSFRDRWRGSQQLDWSFPVYGNLKGYLQFTSGYGESLIDYNHYQTTIGLGILVIDVQ